MVDEIVRMVRKLWGNDFQAPPGSFIGRGAGRVVSPAHT